MIESESTTSRIFGHGLICSNHHQGCLNRDQIAIIIIYPFNAKHILSERSQDFFNHILKYDPQLPWMYICILTKAVFFFYPVSFASGSIVKKGRKKQLLSATTVKTRERPGKIKKCIREDVYIRPWLLNHDFWTYIYIYIYIYIYVHGIERVKDALRLIDSQQTSSRMLGQESNCSNHLQGCLDIDQIPKIIKDVWTWIKSQ